MGNIAYSYLRFSTPSQAVGDSSRRQRTMVENYAAERGLVLDETLTFSDLGVSAYRSKNAKVGALRSFLDAIEMEVITPGSFLLVESLDRISRDQILNAQGLFLQIISAGITLVTMTDRREYSVKSINENPFELIISLVTMMRANEESTVKSQRLRENWIGKRLIASNKPMTSVCPGWLKLNKKTCKFEIKKEHANVIRGIFKDSLAGKGRNTIARELNEASAVSISTGKAARFWQSVTIGRILRSHTVIGTMTPTIGVMEGGIYKRIKQNPILNYYPNIVDIDTFNAVQIKLAERKPVCTKRHKDRGLRNILAKLSRCADCGSSMILSPIKRRGKGHSYLHCYRAQSGAGCTSRYIRYKDIEDKILNNMSKFLSSRDSIMDTPLKDVHHTPQFIEENSKHNVIIKPENLNAFFNARFDELHAISSKSAPNISKINASLRRCLTSVLIDYRNHRLIVRWRDGAVGSFTDVWPPSYLPDALRLRRLSFTGRPTIDPAQRLKDYGRRRAKGEGRYPILTLTQVIEAHRRRSAGATIVAIAEYFKVSTTTIYRRLIETRSDYTQG